MSRARHSELCGVVALRIVGSKILRNLLRKAPFKWQLAFALCCSGAIDIACERCAAGAR